MYNFSDNFYELIPSRRGKDLILFRGFTFSRRGNNLHWYCSKKDRGGCGAKLRLDHCNKIKFMSVQHNHPQPIIHITAEGEYLIL